MSVGLNLSAEEDLYEENIVAFSPAIAAEMAILAELGDGTILDFISKSDECIYHEPWRVLNAVVETIRRAEKLNPASFANHKNDLICGLRELETPLEYAIDVGVLVWLRIC